MLKPQNQKHVWNRQIIGENLKWPIKTTVIFGENKNKKTKTNPTQI